MCVQVYMPYETIKNYEYEKNAFMQKWRTKNIHKYTIAIIWHIINILSIERVSSNVF